MEGADGESDGGNVGFMKTLIEIHGLCAGYDGKEVLHDVNLTVYENDFLGVIGPNGGGKTTLMRCLLGLLQPAKGEIVRLDDNLRIGYLPQQNLLDRRFPITVLQVVLSGLAGSKSKHLSFSSADKEDAFRIITQMGLEGLENHSIGALSGGQLQRALLGRALISHPRLLILDEPATYLDHNFQSRLSELLAQVNRSGCAIILVSHDVGSVLSQVKNIACVNRCLHYHSAADVDAGWLQQQLGCPIDLLGHGHFPHRVVANHSESCGQCQ